jgi:sarcosine oxidase gamma subunit
MSRAAAEPEFAELAASAVAGSRRRPPTDLRFDAWSAAATDFAAQQGERLLVREAHRRDELGCRPPTTATAASSAIRLAMHGPDAWRLTDEAERRYGWALRIFQEWLDELREQRDVA